MPYSVTKGRPTLYSVADCAQVDDMIQAARRQYNHIASDPVAEIDNHARTVMAALDDTAGARAETVRQLDAALGGSGDQLIRLSRSAVISSADLFLALAVQSGNPQLIASATAVDLVVDTTEFVIQIATADDGITRQQAIVALVEGRWNTMFTLVSGPGRGFTERHMAVAEAMTDTMIALGQAVIDELELRQKLTKARVALEAIETQIADLPVNRAQWQQFMLNQLDEEIFMLELLRNENAGTGCRIDGVVIHL